MDRSKNVNFFILLSVVIGSLLLIGCLGGSSGVGNNGNGGDNGSQPQNEFSLKITSEPVAAG